MHVIVMVERHWMIIYVHYVEEIDIIFCPKLLHDVSICRLRGIWTDQGSGIAICHNFERKTTPNTRQVPRNHIFCIPYGPLGHPHHLFRLRLFVPDSLICLGSIPQTKNENATEVNKTLCVGCYTESYYTTSDRAPASTSLIGLGNHRLTRLIQFLKLR